MRILRIYLKLVYLLHFFLCYINTLKFYYWSCFIEGVCIARGVKESINPHPGLLPLKLAPSWHINNLCSGFSDFLTTLVVSGFFVPACWCLFNQTFAVTKQYRRCSDMPFRDYFLTWLSTHNWHEGLLPHSKFYCTWLYAYVNKCFQ